MNKRVTIHHVAEEAGVSRQTVSRVVNNRPDVAPETRKRIKEVITRLGYQPNAIARSLSQQKSYTLGVVIAGLKFIGPSRTLNGIAEMAEEMGYALLLKELLSFDTNDVYPLLQWFLARQVDGIIWAVPEVGDNRRWLEERLPALPVPLIFLTMQSREGIPVVSVDNYSGGRMATEHLLEIGRRNVAHVAGPIDWWEAQNRKQGWQDALEDAGMRVDEGYWAEGTWSPRSGERAISQLLSRYPEMDAVFVGNDQMALGVMQVLSRKGIAIPGDIAVVGFDGIPDAACYLPPLTSVSQNQHELGCVAIKELVRLVEAGQQEDKVIEPKQVLIQPELIIRESG